MIAGVDYPSRNTIIVTHRDLFFLLFFLRHYYMPNKASYLSYMDVENIISLRGVQKPSEIASRYKIGLTRLYKIWTDASPNKKFPGGFTGTQAGKKLTEVAKKLTEENNQRAEISKIQEEFNSLQGLASKTRDNIKQKQQQVQNMMARYKLLQQQQQQIQELLTMIPDNEQQLKTLTTQKDQQQKTIDELNLKIAENKKTIENQTINNAQLQKIIDDNDTIEQGLNEILSKPQPSAPKHWPYGDKSVEQILTENLLKDKPADAVKTSKKKSRGEQIPASDKVGPK
ncbi:hypothetical protein CHS0354_039039 [Potamilus streckersoni]|uniref:Uncharacterized protein n=1 Tax=Potamilus streckersoni TaxID=2493646 RepID=A0AAE0RRK0_9BIVA|nr:hypothetical protein CHS0354_039039 [Potamilus streckersoni]